MLVEAFEVDHASPDGATYAVKCEECGFGVHFTGVVRHGLVWCSKNGLLT